MILIHYCLIIIVMYIDVQIQSVVDNVAIEFFAIRYFTNLQNFTDHKNDFLPLCGRELAKEGCSLYPP